MLKLYRKENGKVVAYHEAWADDGEITEHWGPLGERGKTREHKLGSHASDDKIQEVLRQPIAAGLTPIDDEDHFVLIIEYEIDGWGTEADLDKRHELEDRMNETLGWTGLGHCDGGSIGSGTMEVFCYVVDRDVAVQIVEDDLKGTDFADYSRIECLESE